MCTFDATEKYVMDMGVRGCPCLGGWGAGFDLGRGYIFCTIRSLFLTEKKGTCAVSILDMDQ